MTSRPPDIVLFMTDQQRADQVGYAPDSRFDTPALDSLARAGAVFEQAYSPSPTCVPARNGLLTGVQPHRLATQINGMALREGCWTLPRALRSAGYQCVLVGKMHFAPIHADHGFDVMRTCEHLSVSEILTRPDGSADFDDYHDWLLAEGLHEYRRLPPGLAGAGARSPELFPYDVGRHPNTWVEREAVSVLEARDPNRPLFLVVSFPHPHPPLDPPQPYASMHDPEDLTLPIDGFEVNAGLPRAFRRALEGSDPVPHPRRADTLTRRRLRIRLNKTRALVRQIDDALGRLLGLLSLDETLVFFTSDHGDYGGHRGLLLKVPWIPFDDLVRVPLVAAGPGVPKGVQLEEPVQSFDIVPTSCDAAGVAVDPCQFDAQSLWPHLAPALHPTSAAEDRSVVFATSVDWPGARLGTFKYVRHRPSGQAVLFDLAEDPGETMNLIADTAFQHRAVDVILSLQRALERPAPDLPVSPAPTSA